jgi:hypothetical protein
MGAVDGRKREDANGECDLHSPTVQAVMPQSGGDWAVGGRHLGATGAMIAW